MQPRFKCNRLRKSGYVNLGFKYSIRHLKIATSNIYIARRGSGFKQGFTVDVNKMVLQYYYTQYSRKIYM